MRLLLAGATLLVLLVVRAPRQATQEVPEELESPEQIGDVSPPTVPGARPLLSLPESTYFAAKLHPRQTPFLFAHPDGRALLGCLQTSLGEGDEIELRDVTRVQGVKENVPVRRVNAPRSEIVRPTGVVDAKGRVVLVWTELVSGRPQLRASRESREENREELGPPVTLTTTAAPNLNPEATLHSDGRVWVAWESDVARDGARPSRDVLVAPLEGETPDALKLGTAFRVGDLPGSDLDACVASAGGRLWIVWSGYCGRDYEVMARSLDTATGQLSDPINVSSDAVGDDVHPTVAAAKDGELWIAWDRVAIPSRGSSLRTDARPRAAGVTTEVWVRCATLRDGHVLLPKATADAAAAGVADGVVAGAPFLSAGGGLPRITVARDGGVWVAYRYLYRVPNTKRRFGFPVLVQRLGVNGWSDPFEVQDSSGMTEAPALLADGNGVLVAFHADDRVEMKKRERTAIPEKLVEPLLAQGVVCSGWNGVAEIGFARARFPTEPPRGDSPLVERPVKLDPPHFHPAGDRLDDPIVSGERHFEVARGDDHWSVWWGDLHRHSSVSRCSAGFEPTPEDRWTGGRDVQLCDFMALTDHTGAIDPVTWWQLDKLGWLYQSENFCTLLGWEWSTGEWGHHNVILRGRMSPMVSERAPAETFFKSLRAGDCVTIPHHSSEGAFSNDFSVIDDRLTRLIEVYQSCRGNFEFDGCFKQATGASVLGSFVQDALQQGHKFGIIASSDHGFGSSYACVLAERLDRESIFQALHARRTYGATTKGMFVDFRVDDAVMGEELAIDHAPRIKLVARGAAELADVAIYKDGALFQSLRKGSAPANSFSPVRLDLHLVLPTAEGAAPPRLSLLLPGGHFTLTQPGRGAVDRKNRPAWVVRGDEATLEVPETFLAKAGAGERTLDLPLALFVPAGGTLTVRGPDGERSYTVAELLPQTISGAAADGSRFELRSSGSDCAIDLAKGLGTRDFTGEWDDAGLKPGSSWYYARIVQVDGEIAWSSPIFVTRK